MSRCSSPPTLKLGSGGSVLLCPLPLVSLVDVVRACSPSRPRLLYCWSSRSVCPSQLCSVAWFLGKFGGLRISVFYRERCSLLEQAPLAVTPRTTMPTGASQTRTRTQPLTARHRERTGSIFSLPGLQRTGARESCSRKHLHFVECVRTGHARLGQPRTPCTVLCSSLPIASIASH